jgi:hypothetical protein
VELTAGETVMRAGDTSNIPLQATATAGLTALQFTVRFPDTRLGNLWLEPLAAQLTGATLDTNAPGSALVSFTGDAGQPIQGSQTLARLHFTAAQGYHSAFVPLELLNPSYTRATAGLQPTVLLNNGRAVVIEAEPLLEALSATNQTHSLFLYGHFGVAYTIETSTGFDPISWTTWQPVTLTNLFQNIPLTNSTTSSIFYRARD